MRSVSTLRVKPRLLAVAGLVTGCLADPDLKRTRPGASVCLAIVKWTSMLLVSETAMPNRLAYKPSFMYGRAR